MIVGGGEGEGELKQDFLEIKKIAIIAKKEYTPPEIVYINSVFLEKKI